jgi:hypothetical protein
MSGLERPLAVATGGAHTCALGQDGKVRCLGSNRLGEAGGGEHSIALAPELIAGAGGMRGLVAGNGFTCGLREGQPHCWGWIDTIPGVGPELAAAAAVDPARDVRELGVAPDAYDDQLCWASARQVSCFPHSRSDEPKRFDSPSRVIPRQRLWSSGIDCLLATDGVVTCGRVRLDARSFRDGDPPAAVAVPTDVVEIASSHSQFCGRRKNGRVACVRVDSGRVLRAAEVSLGRGGRHVPLTDAVAIASDGGRICALRRGGALLCWAPDDRFELVAEALPGVTDATAVRFSDSHACAIRRDRTVVCWGRNHLGQLGDGTVIGRDVPVPVPDLRDVRELALGPGHTCARDGQDRVWCWGEHFAGGRAARAVANDDVREAVVVPGLPDMLPARAR